MGHGQSLAAGMVVFAFVVMLAMIADRATLCARPVVSEAEGIEARFSGSLGAFAFDFAFQRAAARRDGALRSLRMRQDHAVALHRRTQLGSRRPLPRQWRSLAGRRRRCSRRPIAAPLGYVFQEASLFPHLSVKANLRSARRRLARRRSRRSRWDEVVDLLRSRAAA